VREQRDAAAPALILQVGSDITPGPLLWTTLDVPAALAPLALVACRQWQLLCMPEPRLTMEPLQSGMQARHWLPTNLHISFSGTCQTPRAPRRQELQALLADLLGERVAADQPLMEAGLDSIGAVELRNAVAAKFGVDLPATATFDFPTLGALAAHVAGPRGGGAPARGRPAAQGLQQGRVPEDEGEAAWMQRVTEARPRRPRRRPGAARMHGHAARAFAQGPRHLTVVCRLTKRR
jgi:acyl carrier protein